MDEDATVLMLGEEEAPKDPTRLIVDALGVYENCTFIPHVKHMDITESDIESSCESELVPIDPTRRCFYFEF